MVLETADHALHTHQPFSETPLRLEIRGNATETCLCKVPEICSSHMVNMYAKVISSARTLRVSQWSA